MNKAIFETRRKLRAGTFVLGLGVLSSCGIPSAGCGDGVVCLEDGATTGETAKASDIKVGKYAYSPNGEVIEGKLDPALESASTKIRDFGTAVLTLMQEALAPNSSGYRVAPVAEDGELRLEAKLLMENFDADCGQTGSVSNRILDCRGEYSASATWVGSTEGLYAETTWTLVTRDTAAQIAIWKDNGSGYLWTTKIATDVSFCQAAGVDGTSYTVNCNSNNADKLTYCSENSGFTYDTGVAAKLGNLSVSSGKVMWRLPTRADFLKAELDGLRYVLPMAETDNFWSANTWSVDAGSIWTFSGSGVLTTTEITNLTSDVICVGVEETQE
jgi:hypothetical protein